MALRCLVLPLFLPIAVAITAGEVIAGADISPDHRRIYGMRQDTESLNAQLDRTFYGQRLPAWGVQKHSAVVLLVAVAENAWARQVWQRMGIPSRIHPWVLRLVRVPKCCRGAEHGIYRASTIVV